MGGAPCKRQATPPPASGTTRRSPAAPRLQPALTSCACGGKRVPQFWPELLCRPVLGLQRHAQGSWAAQVAQGEGESGSGPPPCAVVSRRDASDLLLKRLKLLLSLCFVSFPRSRLTLQVDGERSRCMPRAGHIWLQGAVRSTCTARAGYGCPPAASFAVRMEWHPTSLVQLSACVRLHFSGGFRLVVLCAPSDEAVRRGGRAGGMARRRRSGAAHS